MCIKGGKRQVAMRHWELSCAKNDLPCTAVEHRSFIVLSDQICQTSDKARESFISAEKSFDGSPISSFQQDQSILTMATAATLNPEPSLPSERQEHHLPPKSYADAAVEDMGSEANQDNTFQALYAGQGKDDAPRKPQRNMHKKTGSLRVNGFSKGKNEPHVVIERFEDKDGEHLVSITPGWDSKRGEPSIARRNSELVSGRKAGARWEQSRYGDIQTARAFPLIE